MTQIIEQDPFSNLHLVFSKIREKSKKISSVNYSHIVGEIMLENMGQETKKLILEMIEDLLRTTKAGNIEETKKAITEFREVLHRLFGIKKPIWQFSIDTYNFEKHTQYRFAIYVEKDTQTGKYLVEIMKSKQIGQAKREIKTFDSLEQAFNFAKNQAKIMISEVQQKIEKNEIFY